MVYCAKLVRLYFKYYKERSRGCWSFDVAKPQFTETILLSGRILRRLGNIWGWAITIWYNWCPDYLNYRRLTTAADEPDELCCPILRYCKYTLQCHPRRWPSLFVQEVRLSCITSFQDSAQINRSRQARQEAPWGSFGHIYWLYVRATQGNRSKSGHIHWSSANHQR